MATKYGFNITIGADTNPFINALKKLNAPIQEAQRNLQRIDQGLKLNPTNTALLGVKQEELASKIVNTKLKIEGLQEALRNLNTEYQKNGQYTQEQEVTYRKLIAEIATSQEELRQLQNEYSSFGSVGVQKLKAVGEAMQTLGNKITEVGKSMLGLSTATGALLGIGIKYNANIEQSTKAFEAFLGSADEADKAIKQLKEDGKRSLFNTEEIISANQKLISTGIDADTARTAINGLADALALSGKAGDNDALGRMADNLQQISNNGKATAMDIRQFGNVGINVYGILQDALGMTTEEIKEQGVTFEDLSLALKIASEEGGKYYQGQEIMSQSLAGATNLLKKSFTDLMGEITQSLTPVIVGLTQNLQGLVNWFSNLDDSQKQTIATILALITIAGPLLIVIGKITSAIGILFTHIGTIITIAMKLFTFITSTFVPFITTALKGLFTLIMAHPIIAVITVIIGALVLLYNKCEWFRNVVNNVVKAVWNFFSNFGNNMKKLFTETIPNFIQSAINFFSTLPSKIGYLLGLAIGELIKFGINALKWCIENVPKIILNIVNFFATLPSRIGQILVNALVSFGQGLINMIHKAREVIPHVVASIVDGLRQVIPHILNIGRNIVEGLWNGIFNAKAWLRQKVGEFAKGILDGMKNALGIHSPSTLFEKVVGKNIALGIGEGFDKNIGGVVKDMASQVNPALFDVDLGTGSQAPITLNFYPQQMTEAELDMTFNYVNRRLGTQY